VNVSWASSDERLRVPGSSPPCAEPRRRIFGMASPPSAFPFALLTTALSATHGDRSYTWVHPADILHSRIGLLAG
jgi:hypothetical protein